MKRFALLTILPLLATSCASYNGLLPKKDVHITNGKLQLLTPWGQQVLTFDELDTRLANSRNPISPVAPTVTTSTTSTSRTDVSTKPAR